MEYANNHYIPQFILRRFGSKINRYNLGTGKLKVKGSIIPAFCEKNIYPEWLEKKFSELESRMANLIDRKILIDSDEITITRAENWLIKKFFTIATLRTPKKEKTAVKDVEDKKRLEEYGYKEVIVENESFEDYMFRTMKVVLESKDLQDLYNHPEVTYEACKWATLFNSCYIAIWDSTQAKEDFIITDNGMNCEHDKSRFLTYNFDANKPYFNESQEMIKEGYVIKHLKEANESNDKEKALIYFEIFNRMKNVRANYYLFAVSSKRTIALVNPFFRLYDDPSFLKYTKKIPDVWPTLLSKEALESNMCSYVDAGKYNANDKYHYQVKDLSLEDVIIVNCMMLDRVYLWMGFDDSSKIVRSLNVYSLTPRQYQRNHYDKLVEHLYKMGNDFPKSKKYIELNKKLTTIFPTDKEREYIRFFYDFTKHLK